jgi:cell division protein FtsW
MAQGIFSEITHYASRITHYSFLMQRHTISVLIAAILTLVTIGVVMLFSASMVRAGAQYHNPSYFVSRQIIWLVLAVLAAVICARMDMNLLRRAALPLAILCAGALVLVCIPGIGVEVNGSRRWIRLGPLTIQPSEFAKIGIVFACAWWISLRRRYLHLFVRGSFPAFAGLGAFALLLMLEPDFGTTVLVGLVVMTLLFIGGARLAHLAGVASVGIAAFGLMLLKNSNRMERIFAFLDPEKHAQGGGWQLINAWNAFAAGGSWGTGLGNSIQKYYYLPEAHTDFIFPIIGEELGLPATLTVLVLFMTIFVCGMRIAVKANDDFGRFTALGITLMISLQAVINLAVVTGSMPTKGIALPFISYGGSSLLVSSAMCGILVNIAHTSRNPRSKKKTALFKDRKRKA